MEKLLNLSLEYNEGSFFIKMKVLKLPPPNADITSVETGVPRVP